MAPPLTAVALPRPGGRAIDPPLMPLCTDGRILEVLSEDQILTLLREGLAMGEEALLTLLPDLADSCAFSALLGPFEGSSLTDLTLCESLGTRPARGQNLERITDSLVALSAAARQHRGPVDLANGVGYAAEELALPLLERVTTGFLLRVEAEPPRVEDLADLVAGNNGLAPRPFAGLVVECLSALGKGAPLRDVARAGFDSPAAHCGIELPLRRADGPCIRAVFVGGVQVVDVSGLVAGSTHKLAARSRLVVDDALGAQDSAPSLLRRTAPTGRASVAPLTKRAGVRLRG